MAGSKKWYVYTSDNGTEFAVNLDESNVEAVNTTVAHWAVADTRFTPPRNMQIRRFIYISPDGRRKITCVPLTLTEFATPPSTIVDPLGDGTATLNFLDQIAERIKPNPRQTDTGLNDGDDP